MNKIIDAHAHVMLRPYATLPVQTPAELMDRYAEYGIDQVWVSSADALVDNQCDTHRRCNDEMAEFQRRFGERFVGLATVNPRHPDAAARELDRAMNELGLRGLKVHGWLQPVSCCDACLQPLFDLADRLEVVVLFHDGTPPFTSSLQIGWLAEHYPRCKMILGHGGLKDLAVNAAQAARRYPNVYLQTPATTLLALKRAIRMVDPTRILFGSDGGFGDPRWIDYNLRKIRKWRLEPDVEAMILGGNAMRLMQRSESR